MRISTFGALSAALAVMAVPSTARAFDPITTRDFGITCRIGLVRTCASISVSTQLVSIGTPPVQVTRVVISVANMQGSTWLDNTSGSLITQIGLTAPQLTGAANLTVAGPAGAGAPAGQWTINNQPIGGAVEFSAGVANINGGIQGCAAADITPASYFRTCGSGAVTFTFTTQTIWSANDAQIVYGVRAVDLNGRAYQCRTEDMATGLCLQVPYGIANPTWDPNTPPSTVPEPATMTLLGLGLAGFGLVERRRKARRKETSV